MADRTMATLSVGAATRQIPVPEGIDTTGFTRRAIPTGVHSPPEVGALFVSDGEHEALLVTCDGLAFRPQQSRITRARIAEAAGLTADAVMLACSHSHALPTVDPSWKVGGRQDEWTEQNATYLENMHRAMEDAAQDARGAARPARIGFGTGESEIVVNRRMKLPDGRMILGINPEGYVDRTVTVVRIDGQDGEPLATLVGFGCHPTTVGPGATVASPDYPAAMRTVVRQATGAPVLFLQGAVGDTGVVDTAGGDPAIADRLGRMLGHEAAKVWEGIETRNVKVRYELTQSYNVVQEIIKDVQPDPPAHVRVALRPIDVPLHDLPEPAAAQEVLDRAEQSIEDALAKGGGDAETNIARVERRWARTALAAIEAGTADHVTTDAQVLVINDVALLGLPVEPFSRTAQVLRDRVGERAVCVGIANGTVGYMPLPEHFAEGGYEVSGACRTWSLPGPLAPEASGIVIDAIAELAEQAART